MLGDACLARDDPHAAMTFHGHALQTAREHAYLGLAAEAGVSLADSSHRCGRLQPAVDHARQALTTARGLRHPITECRALTTLSRLCTEISASGDAARYAKRATLIRDRTGYRP